MMFNNGLPNGIKDLVVCIERKSNPFPAGKHQIRLSTLHYNRINPNYCQQTKCMIHNPTLICCSPLPPTIVI